MFKVQKSINFVDGCVAKNNKLIGFYPMGLLGPEDL